MAEERNRSTRKRSVSKMKRNEVEIRDYLLKKLLRDKGFDLYYQELKDYDLNIRPKLDHDAPGLINYKDKVIKLKKAFYENSTDAEKSLLIRHELLHSMLNHINRAVDWYAEKLHYNPATLTKKQYRNVLEGMGYLMASFGEYSHPVLHNLAGDLHLSNYYTDEDDKIVHESNLLRGLAITDHPEWEGLNYPQLMAAINAENEYLMRMLEDKVYAHTDENGDVVIDREEESIFKTSDEILPEHLTGIVMPKERDADVIEDAFRSEGVEIRGSMALEYDDDGKTVPVITRYGKIEQICTQRVFIYPIFKVKYLYYYQKLSDTGVINCCGLPCIQLDLHRLISSVPVVACSPEDDDYTEDYESSNIKTTFEDWKRDII